MLRQFRELNSLKSPISQKRWRLIIQSKISRVQKTSMNSRRLSLSKKDPIARSPIKYSMLQGRLRTKSKMMPTLRMTLSRSLWK